MCGLNAGPSSRDDGSYPAFEPDHSSLEKIQGAKTRRHILRQNSINWSHEESLGDKERLLENLALYGLIQKEVKGDGNCQVSTAEKEFAIKQHSAC